MQKEIFTNFLNEYSTEFLEAKLKTDAQTANSSTVTSACKDPQRDASKLTADSKCVKKLSRNFTKKAVSALQKKGHESGKTVFYYTFRYDRCFHQSTSGSLSASVR